MPHTYRLLVTYCFHVMYHLLRAVQVMAFTLYYRQWHGCCQLAVYALLCTLLAMLEFLVHGLAVPECQ
jgi:hypothetical protein